jgi:hypothetical protein
VCRASHACGLAFHFSYGNLFPFFAFYTAVFYFFAEGRKFNSFMENLPPLKGER